MISKEKKALQNRSWHKSVLFICSIIVVFGFLLNPNTESVFLWGMRIPEICLSRVLLDLDCFSCGLTRSVTFTAHGEFSKAIEMHFLGPAIFFIAVLQLPYRIWRLQR